MAAPARVWAKVKKLLRLSHSPEMHEAARASEEAQRIMRKHNLTMADFEDDVVEIADEQRDVHRQRLAHAVGLSRRCVSLVNKRGQVAFRGKPTPAKNARETYQSLVKAVEQGAVTNEPGRDLWRLCFWVGFVDAVVNRLIDDEARAWTPAPDPEPVKAAEHVTEIAAIGVEGEVPSVKDEMDTAAKDFAGNFLPGDRQRAFKHFCDRAYAAGGTLGSQIPIESYRQEVPFRKALEEHA